jgi:hypothetical protein
MEYTLHISGGFRVTAHGKQLHSKRQCLVPMSYFMCRKKTCPSVFKPQGIPILAPKNTLIMPSLTCPCHTSSITTPAKTHS